MKRIGSLGGISWEPTSEYYPLSTRRSGTGSAALTSTIAWRGPPDFSTLGAGPSLDDTRSHAERAVDLALSADGK